jgi:hypothetical protein
MKPLPTSALNATSKIPTLTALCRAEESMNHTTTRGMKEQL